MGLNKIINGIKDLVEFGTMTQGISQTGIMEVYEQINSLIVGEGESCQKVLNDRAAFEAALDAGWIGEDREVFKTNMGNLANQISEKLIEYDNAIKAEFQKIVDEWDTFQKNNISAT